MPGPCALVAAITCSGLDTTRFQFIGFLPRKTGELREILQEALSYRGTTVSYEAANRLTKTLKLIETMSPDRLLVVARELTKKFETFHRGTATELLFLWDKQSPKGEIILLISGIKPSSDMNWEKLSPQEHVRYLEETWGLSHKEAIKMAAAERNLPKRVLYKQLLEE